jgi:hypothetical protein
MNNSLDPLSYPNIDPTLNDVISKLPKLQQVQYATNDQMLYLLDIAIKLGLYDAHNLLKTVLHYTNKKELKDEH